MKNKIVVLEISTYRGISPKASHYYGELRDSEYKLEKVELKRTISKEEAEFFTNKDGFRYDEGDSITRFDSRYELEQLAKNIYKSYFPEHIILLCGSMTTVEPIKPLDGPKKFMETATEIYEKYESIPWVEKFGFYDRSKEDRKIVDDLTKIWRKIMHDDYTEPKEAQL